MAVAAATLMEAVTPGVQSAHTAAGYGLAQPFRNSLSGHYGSDRIPRIRRPW